VVVLGRARAELASAVASWRAMAGERIYLMGVGGGVLTFLALPLFQVGVLYLLYGAGSDLLSYIVVAQAANAYVISSLFFVGEILDRERLKGTLVALFLAPCTRFSWLTGFILAGLIETTLMASVILLFGHFALGVQFDPNWLSIGVTLPLFLLSLWGCGVIFSGIGLLIRKANPLSNLLYSFVILLGGAYYPVSSLPEPLHTIARCLPLGYGMQALADASLEHATLNDLAPNLLPLLGFAIVLPAAGACAFMYLERMVRVRGELDLY
jgi:ABC-2 type transport system permease protein